MTTATNQVRNDLLGKVLSMGEMEVELGGQWVLLEDPFTDEYMRPIGGRLLWHTPNRKNLHEKAMELSPKSAAFWYIGPLPQDKEYFL